MRYNCVSWWEVFMRLPHQVSKRKYYGTAEQRSDGSWMCAELQQRFQKRAFYCTENDKKELWSETETHPFQPPLWVDSNVRMSVLVSERSLNSSLLFPMLGGRWGGGSPKFYNHMTVTSRGRLGQRFQGKDIPAASERVLLKGTRECRDVRFSWADGHDVMTS